MSRNVINESHVLNEASCGVPTDLDKLENVKLDTKGVKYVQGVNSVELSKSDSVNHCQNVKEVDDQGIKMNKTQVDSVDEVKIEGHNEYSVKVDKIAVQDVKSIVEVVSCRQIEKEVVESVDVTRIVSSIGNPEDYDINEATV